MNEQANTVQGPGLVAVVADHAAMAEAAHGLAAELNLPYYPERPPVGRAGGARYYLVLRTDRWQLEWAEERVHRPAPLYVDFAAGATGYRIRHSGLRQMIARAVGLPKHEVLWVVDPTAGLGRDAFVLASLGCTVTCVEKNPVVWALLADGLRRAAADAQTRAAAERITLQRADGQTAMLAFNEQSPRPDVIFLDPMFPATKSGAAVKKELQLLRDIVQEPQAEGSLLETALRCARRRVVVKRPRLGAKIPGPMPNFSIKGESARFDVYCLAGP